MNFSLPSSWQLPSGKTSFLAYSIAVAVITTGILRAQNRRLIRNVCGVSACTESKRNSSSTSAALPSWAEISHLSDDDLYELYEASEHIISTFEIRHTALRRIASDAVMKIGKLRESEPATMRLIHDTTTIPVPRVLRFFSVGVHKAHKAMVMDYVPGQTLEDCWPILGFWQRLRVIWTIRGYIRQLRGVYVPGVPREKQFPGPIGSEPSKCYGPLFTEYSAGPFASYDELTAWYMHKLDVHRRVRKADTKSINFDSSLPLVMNHMDLFPNNIILDDSGRVWLIDWEFAGFFPQWFEYTMMHHNWEILGRWKHFIVGFMAGFYDRQAEFIGIIGWTLMTGVLL